MLIVKIHGFLTQVLALIYRVIKIFSVHLKNVTNTKMSVAFDGFSFPVKGKGKIELHISNTKIVLDNVLYSQN